MKWITIYSFDHTRAKQEINNLPSVTVPNQAMSIREIMTRFSQGRPIVASQREEVYDGEDFYPDPKTMDFAEVERLKEQYKDEIDQIKERQKKLKKDSKVLEKVPTEDQQNSKSQQGNPHENSVATVASPSGGESPAAGGR